MKLFLMCRTVTKVHTFLLFILAMVDGKLSQWAYLSSVDTCYERYRAKYAAKHPEASAVTVDHFDYFAFHSPYNKLVQKGFARFLYVDSMADKVGDDAMYSDVQCFKDMAVQDTYESRDLEAAYRTLSNSRYCAALYSTELCCAILY